MLPIRQKSHDIFFSVNKQDVDQHGVRLVVLISHRDNDGEVRVYRDIDVGVRLDDAGVQGGDNNEAVGSIIDLASESYVIRVAERNGDDLVER